MGKFKNNVDYAEILRKEGIELPSMVDDVEERVSDEGDAVIETDDSEEDVQLGTPAQANTMVANGNLTHADMGSHGLTGAVTHGHTPQSHMEGHGKDTEGDMLKTREETQKKTVLHRRDTDMDTRDIARASA